MDEVTDLLAKIGAPSGVIAVVVLLGYFGITSEKIARIPGALGAGARWWSSRQEREVSRELSMQEKVEAAVESRMAPFLKELEDNRRDLNLMYQWAAYASGWYREISLRAAEQGWDLHPPVWQSFEEFRDAIRATAARQEAKSP